MPPRQDMFFPSQPYARHFFYTALFDMLDLLQSHSSVDATQSIWTLLKDQNHASLTWTPALLFPSSTPSNLFHAGGEVYTHSTLQRSGGGRAACFKNRDSGYNESPVKLMRLTKGVSISLPSSPLLPRQADIAPSQSCIKFTGGFIWNSNKNKAWSYYEQLRMTSSCASGNCCKNSRMLLRVCLD